MNKRIRKKREKQRSEARARAVAWWWRQTLVLETAGILGPEMSVEIPELGYSSAPPAATKRSR